MSRDRGEILLAILPLLAGIAALSAAMLFYSGAARAASAENRRTREKTEALAKIRAIAERLLADATPEADSPFDLADSLSRDAGIEDLSASFLLWQEEDVGGDGRRGGPGYLDPFLVTGASKTASLRVFSPALLRAITAAAPVNVNFAPRDTLLRELASYGTDPETARNFADRIVEERRYREIVPSWLAEAEAACGIPQRARMAMGTKTWFWLIRVRAEGREYEALAGAEADDACASSESMTLLSFGRSE